MSNKKLNKEQQLAVKHINGPLLIIAGAGTGKTTVIIEKIKYLIENGSFYQHIYKEIKYKNMDVHENYIDYPETLREAKEFVERYKGQARK